ncbi:MAG TPA: hypothetical protein VIA06_11990 [Candidatus Dormibacteraeota bacterium]|jgi:uncharacterized protein YggT (Ycf19 family)|nr:hypothetical protein [Candidatus Dormibacteraeota bacterium]
MDYRPEDVDPVTPPVRSGVTYNHRAISLIWFIAGVVDILITLRFVCKLLGASELSSFVALLYAITNPLVAPFQGIFGQPAARGSILEPASLVAIVVYLLVAWGLVTLFRIFSRRRYAAGSRTVVEHDL